MSSPTGQKIVSVTEARDGTAIFTDENSKWVKVDLANVNPANLSAVSYEIVDQGTYAKDDVLATGFLVAKATPSAPAVYAMPSDDEGAILMSFQPTPATP